MSQSVADIQQDMITDLVARAAAVGITLSPAEWSDYDYRQLLTYVASVSAGTLSQLWDVYKTDIEALVKTAAPQTPAWLRKQMLLFQFDSTDPQVIQFSETDIAPYYPDTDELLRVIKYCSVVPGAFGITRILVAAQTGGYPADLDVTYPGALAAAQSYANLICVPGMAYNVITGESDKISVSTDVYYQGSYSAVIKANVIAAIQAYLANIPFDGVVLLSGLRGAIKAVEGVNDVVLTDVRARANGTVYSSGTALVLDSRTLQRLWKTAAGYIVGETTAGHTLEDTINLIAQ